MTAASDVSVFRIWLRGVVFYRICSCLRLRPLGRRIRTASGFIYNRLFARFSIIACVCVRALRPPPAVWRFCVYSFSEKAIDKEKFICYNSIRSINAVVVEWQTRYFEGVVRVTSWGFKSPWPHQRDAGPIDFGFSVIFLFTAKPIFNAFFAALLRVAASCISLAATFLQKSPVRSVGCPPSCGARLRPRRMNSPCRCPTAAPTSPRCIPRRGRSDVSPLFRKKSRFVETSFAFSDF